MTVIHSKNSGDDAAARELELYACNVESWVAEFRLGNYWD
jgi:hypothetical protein